MGAIAPGHPLTVPSRLNIWITEESYLKLVDSLLPTLDWDLNADGTGKIAFLGALPWIA